MGGLLFSEPLDAWPLLLGEDANEQTNYSDR